MGAKPGSKYNRSGVPHGKVGDVEGGAVYSDSMSPDDGGNVHVPKNEGSSDHIVEDSRNARSSKRGRNISIGKK